MELTEFTLRVAILGLPGILCYFVYRRLTGKDSDNQLVSILTIFLFSILSYVLYGLCSATINWCKGNGFSQQIIEKIFYSSRTPLSIQEMALSVIIGFALAYVLSFGHKMKSINRLGQFVKATNRYGDEDVWDYFHNLPSIEKNGEWVVVRDYVTGLDYFGSISIWSDPEKMREMVISEVSVFRDEQHLYDADKIYLSRAHNEFSIEVPRINEPEGEDRERS